MVRTQSRLALVIRETNTVTCTQAAESTKPASSPWSHGWTTFPSLPSSQAWSHDRAAATEASRRRSDAEGTGRQSHDTTGRKPPTNQKSAAAVPCEEGIPKSVSVCLFLQLASSSIANTPSPTDSFSKYQGYGFCMPRAGARDAEGASPALGEFSVWRMAPVADPKGRGLGWSRSASLGRDLRQNQEK